MCAFAILANMNCQKYVRVYLKDVSSLVVGNAASLLKSR